MFRRFTTRFSTSFRAPSVTLQKSFQLTQKNAGNYYQYYTKKPLITTTPIALGFFGWLFGSSVDYEKVKTEIANILEDYEWDDGSWGPVLIRLAWHASGTYSKQEKNGGSNGATMRFKPESEDGANAGLEHARNKLELIKKKYPEISYADLWILASYVAIKEMGGPDIPFRSGRKDADHGSKCPPVGRLPDALQGAAHIREVYGRMGLNDQEMVVLIGGGHAIGRCHTDRSGFLGPWTRAPTTISNEFFKVLLDEEWIEKKWNGPKQFVDKKTQQLMMLPTDLVLKSDPEFRKWTDIYYKNEEKFLEDFGKAFKKLTELGF